MSDNYIYLPGTSGNYASTPDAAALDLTGDLWLAARVALPDWTPAADVALVAKWTATGDERSYMLSVEATTGNLMLTTSGDGTDADKEESVSSVAPTVSDGAVLWVGAFLDDSEDVITFYTGGTGLAPSWAQLGTTSAHTKGINSGTAILEVGSSEVGTATLMTGKLYNAQVGSASQVAGAYDAIFSDSSKYAADKSTLTEDANSAAVTMNGNEWTYVNRDLVINNSLLNLAEAIYLARDGNGAYGPNLLNPWADLSGNDHHAQLGSATGADADDPSFHAYDGEKYVYLSAVAGNHLSTPDSAALSVDGDEIDIRIDCVILDTSGDSALVSKDNLGASREWYFQYDASTDTFDIRVNDGTTNHFITSDATGLDMSVRRIYRVTADVDNGSSDSDYKFYHSTDGGSSWTQIGVTKNGGGVLTGILDGSSQVTIGVQANGSTNPLEARIYSAQVYDGIDGTLVFDFNAQDFQEPFDTVAERANGATVTMNYSAIGTARGIVVDQDTWQMGPTSFFIAADHANLNFVDGQAFTLVIAAREAELDTTGSEFRTPLSKWNDAGGGWLIQDEADDAGQFYFWMDDGTNADGTYNLMTAPHAARVRTVFAGRYDSAAETADSSSDGTFTATVDVTAVGDLTVADPMRIGAVYNADPRQDYEGEMMAVLVFRQALTNDQILSLDLNLFPVHDPLLIQQNASSLVRKYDDPYEQVLGDGFTERTQGAVRSNEELVSSIVRVYK